MTGMVSYDESIMREALSLSRDAMQYGEIPVACILVGESGTITSSQTMVRRKGSIAAHGELFAILEAGDRVWSSGPLQLYTTLEPCLMCLGACAQAQVGSLYYGMRAKPDGAGWAAGEIGKYIADIPTVSGGHLEQEEIELMREFLVRWPESPGAPYVKEMLAYYDENKLS